MFKPYLRWIRSHPRTGVFLSLLLIFLLFNAIAFVHARAMTRFVAEGHRTAPPEGLSLFAKVKVLCTGVRIPRPANEADPAVHGLTFETHRFSDDGQSTLEAWHIPHPESKGLVLMFHGYASSKASLLHEAVAFHQLGYATFLVDFHGSGGSSGNDTTVGVTEADDVVSACNYVAQAMPNHDIILFGQSMGSAAILRAIAVNELRPECVILESPFDRLLSTVGNRFGNMGLPVFPMAHLLVFWGGVQQGFNGFSHNPAEYAKAVSCPVLLLHGVKDIRVTKEQAEAVFRNFPGDQNHFELFEDVGHGPFASFRPEQWKAAVTLFLKISPS